MRSSAGPPQRWRALTSLIRSKRLEARVEQLRGALERERSQRLVEKHQHGEALQGARAEAAKASDVRDPPP